MFAEKRYKMKVLSGMFNLVIKYNYFSVHNF